MYEGTLNYAPQLDATALLAVSYRQQTNSEPHAVAKFDAQPRILCSSPSSEGAQVVAASQT